MSQLDLETSTGVLERAYRVYQTQSERLEGESGPRGTFLIAISKLLESSEQLPYPRVSPAKWLHLSRSLNKTSLSISWVETGGKLN
jgi:hypothetical protein